MILLSDVLGISALVDILNSAQAIEVLPTESSVLGPFHHEGAATFENGQSMASQGVIGEPMLIHGTVRAVHDRGRNSRCMGNKWEWFL
jgi:hypothetical protein